MNKSNSRIVQIKHVSRKPDRNTIILTIINLFFAATTVSMTGVSLYNNYFRELSQLSATLSWQHFENNFQADTLVINIAIFNTGNRQALVSHLQLNYVKFNESGSSGWSRLPIRSTAPSLPILLDPGRIALVRIVSLIPILNMYNNSFDCDSTQVHIIGSRCANIGISWTAVNFQGHTFNGLAVVAQVSLTRNGMNGFGNLANEVDMFTNFFDTDLHPGGSTVVR